MGSPSAHEPPPFNLTEVDRQVLSQTDEEFVYHDWENLKDIIVSPTSARNDLGALKRKPSDLVRYIAWSNKIKAEYGSITNYICQERLRWHQPSSAAGSTPVIPFKNPTPFADPADFKILRNDWPYGVTPDVTHLVVWSKTPIAVKPENGDVTDESRALIEDFVTRTFVARLERDPHFSDKARNHVLWFKNWAALQSVRSLEHIHVLTLNTNKK
ncbi:hypothetical protein T310_3281 [Rasamsonia emersonii CBS 393.64]|uniref:N-acetylglucosamine-induced protein 1 n=1 Tax=Rasamsonia emersonii (strain ATCC 16479 / CBS 393.64 / IMI 116815) TaxID=1408163 RepID=A0A0F4YWK4_RASE3|nr:hypothetical protein T310_3281 [Rasamsonia emersonii CBS 393.64]KKA22662.1 hypothetical protein T310_3281 [Rasamsonia emersonii CBS 393.64]